MAKFLSSNLQGCERCCRSLQKLKKTTIIEGPHEFGNRVGRNMLELLTHDSHKKTPLPMFETLSPVFLVHASLCHLLTSVGILGSSSIFFTNHALFMTFLDVIWSLKTQPGHMCQCVDGHIVCDQRPTTQVYVPQRVNVGFDISVLGRSVYLFPL